MSTSAVNSTSLNQLLQQYFQTRGNDLKQLGQALKSGDLTGAQSAYANIVALGQKGPFAGGEPFKITQREQDFGAVGQALQSGDLAGAQQAFASLIGTFNSGSRQLDPPASTGPAVVLNLGSGGGTTGASSGAIASGPEIVLNLGNSSGSTGPEQITLNIAGRANGGEQISLSVGNQGSGNQGPAPEQVQFNLPANTNEQIVLNLLGPLSSTSTGTASSGSSTGGLSVSA